MITPFLMNGFKKSVLEAGGVLYLDARKATGFNIPTNSPLTSPWIDLSGNNNDATPQNMAGTISSGVDITDLKKPTWVLDGSNDYFSLVDLSTLDITSAPLAIFTTIKIASGAGNGFIFTKNVDATSNMQFGLLYNSNNTITLYLENAVRGASALITQNQWYNIGIIWDGTTIKYYINSVTGGTNGSCSSSLTNRANVQIGCRASTSGSKQSFLKTSIATLTVYKGANCIETNVLKAENAISKIYIN